MWATDRGDRVLTGAERRLFATAAGLLASWLDEFDKTGMPLETEAHLFDALTLEQKLAMIDHVANALLNEGVPTPKLTAIREATIGAIYRYLGDHVEMEIDNNEMALRPMILAAALERGVGRAEDGTSTLPEVANSTEEDWFEVVEELSMEVLHDTDWDLPSKLLDMPPEQKRKWAHDFDIDEDYFTDIALDPAPAELVAIRSRLCNLTG